MTDKIKKAEKDYINGAKYKDIASKYSVSINTVKSWKQRYKWCRNGVHTTEKKAYTKKKKERIQKSNAPPKKEEPIQQKNNEALEEYELTERQRLFAEIYVRTPIAYKAAIKAGYSSNSAFVESSNLLRNPKVKAYIDYLKELKRQAINLEIEDLVDLNMRIAFGDIKDYVSFGQRRIPIMNKGEPVVMENPVTGKKEVLTKIINTIQLKEDYEVDGEIISEIKTSRQGTSVKLEDKQKAIQWLTDYFGWNPESKHKKEFDSKKMELEKEKLEHQKDIDDKKYW